MKIHPLLIPGLLVAALIAVNYRPGRGAQTPPTPSALENDAWIAACLSSNAEQRPQDLRESVLVYCTCMEIKLDQSPPRPMTTWARIFPVSHRSCSEAAGWLRPAWPAISQAGDRISG